MHTTKLGFKTKVTLRVCDRSGKKASELSDGEGRVLGTAKKYNTFVLSLSDN